MNQQRIDFEGTKNEATSSVTFEVFPSVILKEIRSWAITLLFLGGVSIFASDYLSASWGIMLIFVGLASFFFRSSAMMVIYAITLVWAGIFNASSGEMFWIAFAVFQWFMAFRIFKTFFRFQKTEFHLFTQKADLYGLTPGRSANIFPWAAGAMGVFSIIGLTGIYVGAIILVMLGIDQVNLNILDFIESMVVNIGILGLSAGLASILCKYSRKTVSIIGIVTGALTLLIKLAFTLIFLD